jgi:Family of unknown function (DUF5335)
MAIATQEIPRDAWRWYFEELTDVLGTVEATVEVVGGDLGDQIADERQILTDITYDHRNDAIIVGLEAPDSTAERTEHVIEQPQQFLVATGEPPPLEMTFDSAIVVAVTALAVLDRERRRERGLQRSKNALACAA